MNSDILCHLLYFFMFTNANSFIFSTDSKHLIGLKFVFYTTLEAMSCVADKPIFMYFSFSVILNDKHCKYECFNDSLFQMSLVTVG